MNDDVRIYICTHTDFKCPVSNPVYEVVDSRALFDGDRAENGMDALFYSELLTYHHLAENANLPKYVGFCHYRKYFSFMDDVPDIGEVVERRGCISLNPCKFKETVYEQYAKCFFFGDLDVMRAVIHERHPWLYHTFDNMLGSVVLYTCNMFIMRREDFIRHMRIVWDLLDCWLDVVGDVKERIAGHKTLYLKDDERGGSMEHQYRIGGNLGERISSALLMYFFPDAKEYGITVTEPPRKHRKLNV